MSDLRPEIRMTEAELQAGVEKFTEDGPRRCAECWEDEEELTRVNGRLLCDLCAYAAVERAEA